MPKELLLLVNTPAKKRLAILILASLICIKIAFLVIAYAVREMPNNSLDNFFANWITGWANPMLEAVMIFASWFGNPPQSILLTLIFGYWLTRRYRKKGFILFILLGGFSLVAQLLKLIVGRVRPEGLVTDGYFLPTDFSFPSGHVNFYVLFFGLIILMALVDPVLKKWRWPLMIFSGLLITLIGISRVYLGVHWASDVFGGYLLGFGLLEVLVVAYFLLNVRKSARPQ